MGVQEQDDGRRNVSPEENNFELINADVTREELGEDARAEAERYKQVLDLVPNAQKALTSILPEPKDNQEALNKPDRQGDNGGQDTADEMRCSDADIKFVEELNSRLSECLGAGKAPSSNPRLEALEALVDQLPEPEQSKIKAELEGQKKEECKLKVYDSLQNLREFLQENSESVARLLRPTRDGHDRLTDVKKLVYKLTDTLYWQNLAGESVAPENVNGKRFIKTPFISSSFEGGTYEDVIFGKGCDGTNMRMEGCKLRNVIAEGLNTISVLLDVTIGEGTKLHNLDQRGKTMKGLSFELNGKVMTSAELLEHAKKSPEARAEVESLLKEVFEGTVWDDTTEMDPELRALLGMVSERVENVSMMGTVLTTREALEDLINKYSLIDGNSHDLSQTVKLQIPGHPEIEFHISPKRSFKDRLKDRMSGRQSEPEEFILKVVDKRDQPDHSPMKVVGCGEERRANPLKVFGFGRGEDESKPLNPAQLFETLTRIVRHHSERPNSDGGQPKAA